MYYNIYEGFAPDTQYNKIALHLTMTVAGLFAFATRTRLAENGNFGNPRLSRKFLRRRRPCLRYCSGMHLYHDRTHLVQGKK